MIDFSSKVKGMCKLKEIQIKELAAKIGISEVGLHANLKNNNPRLETMEKISSALNVTLVDLLMFQPGKPLPKPKKEKKTVPTEDDKVEYGAIRCPHCGEPIELFVRAK